MAGSSARASRKAPQTRIMGFFILPLIFVAGFILGFFYRGRLVEIHLPDTKKGVHLPSLSGRKIDSNNTTIEGMKILNSTLPTIKVPEFFLNESSSNNWHEMDDQTLFPYALDAIHLTRNGSRKCKNKKLAFLFLTRGPLPLALLWSRFFSRNEGKYSIYVHSAPGFKFNRFIPEVFQKTQIPSKKVSWGAMSVVDAERRLLANALLDTCNERFILLSESCVPLYNFSFVYNYLTSTNFSFVNSFDDSGPYGRGRYSNSFLPELQIEQWRKGSQWFEMSRELARAVVNDTLYYEKFKKGCTGHCYSDEHYIATILSLWHPERMSNRSLTFVDWTKGGFHPRMYRAGDVSVELIDEMRRKGERCFWNENETNVCSLFARKVHSSASGKLWFLLRHLGYR